MAHCEATATDIQYSDIFENSSIRLGETIKFFVSLRVCSNAWSRFFLSYGISRSGFLFKFTKERKVL